MFTTIFIYLNVVVRGMENIIIRGPLGIGKTTIAKALAEKLKAEYVSIDELLEKEGLDNVDKKIGKIPLKNFILVNDIIAKMNGDKVIDGNLYYKEQVEDLVKRLGNCKVFTLKASVDVCINRDKSRKRVYGEGAARAVYNLVTAFGYGTLINTENKTKEDVVEDILEVLG